MKDKELNVKLVACLLGNEELFDEVADGLAEKIKEELDEIDDCDDEEEN